MTPIVLLNGRWSREMLFALNVGGCGRARPLPEPVGPVTLADGSVSEVPSTEELGPKLVLLFLNFHALFRMY